MTEIGEPVVDVDLNPPMAGKTLEFALEVVEVRAATLAPRTTR